MSQSKRPPESGIVESDQTPPTDPAPSIDALVRRNELARQRSEELEKQLKDLVAKHKSRK